MDYELVDLIDIEELKKLTDNWTQLIGLPMGIFDPYGSALLGSGWLSVCTDFHRVNPVSAERCRQSDLETFIGTGSRNVTGTTWKSLLRKKPRTWPRPRKPPKTPTMPRAFSWPT